MNDPPPSPELEAQRTNRGRGLLVLSIVAVAASAALAVLLSRPGLQRLLPPARSLKWMPAFLSRVRLDPRGFRLLLEVAAPFVLSYPLFLFFQRRDRTRQAAADRAFLVCAVVVGVLLRVHLWATRSFWIDAYALKAALRVSSFAEVFAAPLRFNQSAPVGFCLVEKAIGELFGWSNLALTFPMLLAGLAVLLLFPVCLGRLGFSRFLGPMTLLLAISPHLVFYSTEFKQYGIDAFFAALSLFAAVELGRDRRPRALLLLLFVGSPFFSHTQFFLLPGLGLLLLLRTFRREGRWRLPPRPELALFLCCAVFGGGAVLASYVHTVATMPNVVFNSWGSRDAFAPTGSLREFVDWAAKAFFLFFREPFPVLPVPRLFSWSEAILFLPAPALLVLGAASRECRKAATIALAPALALLVLAAAMDKWPVWTGDGSLASSRHLVFLLPVAFIFLACGLGRIARFSTVFAALLAVASAFTLASRLLALDDRDCSSPWDDAIAELIERSADGAPILLGHYHYVTAWSVDPDWMERNKARISRLGSNPDLARKLDDLAASPPPEGFWVLWAERGQEKTRIPKLCGEHFRGHHADFVRKTPAGNLQHFPGKNVEFPVSPESGVH